MQSEMASFVAGGLRLASRGEGEHSWLKVPHAAPWASSCAFFILHNGFFLSCILLICLCNEIYYLLDFCNSFAPKSKVGCAESLRHGMCRVRGVGCAESPGRGMCRESGAWDVQRVQGVGCAESPRPHRTHRTQGAWRRRMETRGQWWRLGRSCKEAHCPRRA